MIHDPPGICPSSPFKLLGSYVEADVDIFGGREQEIFDITARLASRGMLVIYGPSGIGKTSLIQAGIFPHVRDLGWSYAYVRVLTDPLADLATALTQRLGPLTGPERTDVIERIAGYADRAPLLIAFDQFEEFFTRLQANLRDAFISMVADLSHRSDIDCRILFSLREDYFAKFDEFRRKLPDILNNSYRIGSLSAFGAREAITRPLLQRNIPLENRLIPSLLDELVKFDFDPAFLQILCGELVRTASERDPCLLRITAADFSALGGIEGIFDRYLDNALNDLPADKRLLARLVLDVLISPDRIKHAMRPDDFLTERFVVTIEELTTILNTACLSRSTSTVIMESSTSICSTISIPPADACGPANVAISSIRSRRRTSLRFN